MERVSENRAVSPRWVGVIVALTVASTFAFVAVPRVRATPGLLGAVLGAGASIAIAVLLLWRRDRRTGQRLRIERVIRAPHYVQLVMHTAVFAYWGSAWDQVASQAPLIVAQVAFAYGCELVLSWRRYGCWRLGFGPWPVVGSTNLFLWWHDPFFGAQFAMIALAYISRDMITWRRGAGRSHIFNPSAFGLAIAAAVMVGAQVAHHTWGVQISQTLGWPPLCYEVIFAVGVVVMVLFRVTLVTVGAAVATVTAGAVYHAVTGTYLYLDTAIPIAVFLGMNLLITDPASSPRRPAGRFIFGALYGLMVFALYPLLVSIGHPPSGDDPGLHVSFLDKLLPVPILNLCVRRIDALVDRLPTPKWRPARANLVFVGVWVGVFLLIRPSLVDHPGRRASFWEQACTEGLPRGCEALALAWDRACDDGAAPACHNLAMLRLDGGKGLPADLPGAVVALDRACELDQGRSCGELGVLLIQGRGVEASPAVGRAVFGRGCDLGDAASCVRLAVALRSGIGGPVELGTARALLAARCRPDAPQACQEYAIALAMSPGRDPTGAAAAAEVACNAGLPLGCNVLGGLVMEARPPDPARAIGLFGRACAAGLVLGCKHQADVLRIGGGIAREPARAAALYRQACEAGEGSACEDGALMLWSGDGIPRDADGALDLLQRACDLGRSGACERHRALRGP